jgi:NADPH:quinone reductase
LIPDGHFAAQNASVIRVVLRPEQTDYVRSLGREEMIVSLRGGLPSLQPESVDGVLDAVGGNVFGTCVEALRPTGVLSLFGAVAGGDVRFDAWQLTCPVTLTGYSTESLDGRALRNAVTVLADWLATGSIKPPARATVPLAEAARAHDLLERGGVTGRVLLLP